MSNNWSGSNAKYGSAKRKRGSNPSMVASKLSRKLFFKGGRPEPQISSMVFDKAVGRALRARRITPPEQKFIEVVTGGAVLSTASVMVLLNGLTQGDNISNRTGAKVRITKLEFTAVIELGITAPGGNDYGLVSLFVKKQTNAAAPNAFIGAPASGNSVPYTGITAGGIPALKTALQESEYYIIKDWNYSLDASASQGTTTIPDWQSDTLRLHCEVPINRVVNFNDANTGTVADIVTNAFYLGYAGSNSATINVQSLISYFVRIWFTDA